MADPNEAAGAPPRPPSDAARPGLILRILGDHLTWIALIWIALAFVLRPAAMAAHYGDTSGLSALFASNLDTVARARVAGLLQWGAFAGLILLLALGHVRYLAAMPEQSRTFIGRFAAAGAYAAAFTLGYIAFIWTPVTAVSLMLHDTFIFYDAIYRIDHGQHPSTDFPTALGAAMLYLPWVGAKIAGGYGGAIEMSSAIVCFFLCLACAQACAARHGAAVTATLVAAIFLIVVPVMLEGYDAPSSATFEGGEFANVTDDFANAMFYNRWGWGALIAVFAFLTPRAKDTAAPIAEIVTLGLLLVFLFWLKLSYFAVAAAAAVVYAFLGAKPWRTLLVGGGVAIAGTLLVALFTGNLIAYIADVLAVGRVSGMRFTDLASLIRDNLLELLIAIAPAMALGLLGKLKREDIWVTGLILAGTLFVINQNAQTSGMPTMLVAAAYAIWRLREEESRPLVLLAMFCFALPAATYIMDRASGLLGQTTIARREEARPPSLWAAIPAMKNVYAQEHEDMFAPVQAAATEEDRLNAFRYLAIYGRRQFLRTGEYMASHLAGMKELRAVMQPNDSVVELDFSSPLAFLLNARPAKGFWITFDDGRTIDDKTYPKPEDLFADADHVMAPRLFVEPDTALRLRKLYSDWLDAHYAERVETPYWTRWSKRRTQTSATTQLTR